MQNKHTFLMSPRTQAFGVPVLFLALALLALWQAWAMGPGSRVGSLTNGLPQDRAPLYYARVSRQALEINNTALALEAARLETNKAPYDHGAWQRRAAAASAHQGTPDREALGSLLQSYELAPFPSPTDMAWRVDYAAHHWTSMPDLFQELSISQIEALGGMSDTWEKRKDWCRNLPDSALAVAACATVPGTWRNGVQQ